MPRNQLERMFFAFVTVVITVHAYVFYSLYVVNGHTLMSLNDSSTVLGAIDQQGGVYMLGRYLPIWCVVLVDVPCHEFSGGYFILSLLCRFSFRHTSGKLDEACML